MVDLLIPIAARTVQGESIPLLRPDQMQNVVGLRGRKRVDDLSQVFGGRAAKPRQNVVIVGPDGRTPIIVCGLGLADVAEIQETALAAIEQAESDMKGNSGRAFPFEELRERRGQIAFKDFPDRVRELAENYAQYVRRNWRSVPDAVKRSPFVTKGQSMVTVPEKSWEPAKHD